ncbi:hypothetical protein ANN_20374 [Periplaneta americana]|uniref:Uncharacterized protein n=1 Tax=Periplaneta americana TaxID=6978 RepID=A0ABQ8SCI9_PERAM|nr:hypothetical protein ANN_20374 [Periplaneta americana]
MLGNFRCWTPDSFHRFKSPRIPKDFLTTDWMKMLLNRIITRISHIYSVFNFLQSSIYISCSKVRVQFHSAFSHEILLSISNSNAINCTGYDEE